MTERDLEILKKAPGLKVKLPPELLEKTEGFIFIPISAKELFLDCRLFKTGRFDESPEATYWYEKMFEYILHLFRAFPFSDYIISGERSNRYDRNG